MNAKRQGDVAEAFEILGNKAAAVDKHTFGVILRSVGMNPTNDEIAAMYSSKAGGEGVDLPSTLELATKFEAGGSASTEAECVLAALAQNAHAL